MSIAPLFSSCFTVLTSSVVFAVMVIIICSTVIVELQHSFLLHSAYNFSSKYFDRYIISTKHRSPGTTFSKLLRKIFGRLLFLGNFFGIPKSSDVRRSLENVLGKFRECGPRVFVSLDCFDEKLVVSSLLPYINNVYLFATVFFCTGVCC